MNPRRGRGCRRRSLRSFQERGWPVDGGDVGVVSLPGSHDVLHHPHHGLHLRQLRANSGVGSLGAGRGGSSVRLTDGSGLGECLERCRTLHHHVSFYFGTQALNDALSHQRLVVQLHPARQARHFFDVGADRLVRGLIAAGAKTP